MQILFRAFLIITLGINGCGQREGKSEYNNSLADSDIDNIKLYALNGTSIDLNKYKGKTVFINFWATWCRPCLEEMPSIQKAMDILKNEEIEFLFASGETDEQVESFTAEYDYGFNFVHAGNLEELNIVGLPTTFIFNAEGELAFSEMGKRNWDEKENIDLILNIIKSK